MTEPGDLIVGCVRCGCHYTPDLVDRDGVCVDCRDGFPHESWREPWHARLAGNLMLGAALCWAAAVARREGTAVLRERIERLRQLCDFQGKMLAELPPTADELTMAQMDAAVARTLLEVERHRWPAVLAANLGTAGSLSLSRELSDMLGRAGFGWRQADRERAGAVAAWIRGREP